MEDLGKPHLLTLHLIAYQDLREAKLHRDFILNFQFTDQEVTDYQTLKTTCSSYIKINALQWLSETNYSLAKGEIVL